MDLRYNSAIFTACLFALTGLIVPSALGGADAAYSITGKNLKSNTPAASNNCDNTHAGAIVDGDCKLDSKKTSKIDLDRKGHKVKKSKSRGR